MDKKINKKALIISLVLALISCALVYNYIRNLDQPVKESAKVKLLVASRNIKVGEEIKASDINTMDVSQDSLPAGIINDRKSIEGLFAKESIIIGEPFRQERLAEEDHLALSFNIPEGMRALSLSVNENTIFSNQLRVGDKVDVIGNFEVEGIGDKKIQTSRTILQNIEVLAIGGSQIQNSTANTAQATDENSLPRTVTLCVSPGDAEKMTFTNNYASYTFALRGRNDDKKTNTSGAIVDELVPNLIFR